MKIKKGYLGCFLTLTILFQSHFAFSDEIKASVSEYWQHSGSRERKAKQLLIDRTNGNINTLYEALKSGPSYTSDVPRGILHKANKLRGSTRLPYVVVVPDNYDPAVPTSVEFMLHGGVHRPEWESKGEWWADGKNYEKYRKRDQITVFPAAWHSVPWWSDDQAKNLQRIVVDLKRTYNIDDNRVYLAGVSDGGTGAYFMALKQPTPWAAFLPYIGHIEVLANEYATKKKRIEFENLKNSQFYMVNGEHDRLYPAESMQKYISAMEKANVKHEFIVIEDGKHNLKWFKNQKADIEAFKQRTTRNPHPEFVTWTTNTVDRYADVHWLSVKKLTKKNETGWIAAIRQGNEFTVYTDGIDEFTLKLSPDVIDFDQKVTVKLNDVVAINERILPDVETLFESAKARDRSQLYTAEIAVSSRANEG